MQPSFVTAIFKETLDGTHMNGGNENYKVLVTNSKEKKLFERPKHSLQNKTVTDFKRNDVKV